MEISQPVQESIARISHFCLLVYLIFQEKQWLKYIVLSVMTFIIQNQVAINIRMALTSEQAFLTCFLWCIQNIDQKSQHPSLFLDYMVSRFIQWLINFNNKLQLIINQLDQLLTPTATKDKREANHLLPNSPFSFEGHFAHSLKIVAKYFSTSFLLYYISVYLCFLDYSSNLSSQVNPLFYLCLFFLFHGDEIQEALKNRKRLPLLHLIFFSLSVFQVTHYPPFFF